MPAKRSKVKVVISDTPWRNAELRRYSCEHLVERELEELDAKRSERLCTRMSSNYKSVDEIY